MTIGRILAYGDKNGDKGSGFSIATATGRSSNVVLTAAHVVGGRDASSLAFLVPGGRVIPVERVESDADIDVAVLHLREEIDGFVATRVRDGLRWRVDARPLGNDPRLTGEVIDGQRLFRTARGPDIRVIQLRTEDTLGDYQGYSGSPVMLGLTESPPVLGVLIEQLRRRTPVRPGQPKPDASNVLYAIAIQDVLARFGLDTTWVPAGDLPADDELASRYVASLTARFAERFDATPHVALALERGERAPAAVPQALRRQQARIRERMRPGLSATPPGRDPDSGQPIADLAEFQQRRVRVVLLGRPGAGKSVTLRHLVTDLGAPRIPIYADLSEWHDPSADLPAFLQAQLASLGQHALAERLPVLMRTDRLVLLLDGLNEMPQLGRDPDTDRLDDPRVTAIAELGRRADWNAVGCVLSCRVNDFPGGPEWHDLYLLDLDRERVAALAEAYFHDLSDPPAVTRDFLRRLLPSASGRLGGLISNPFFLVMALAYYSELGTIPDPVTDLLELTIAEVLEREHVGDRAGELRQRLGRLAFRMTASGEFGAAGRERAAGWFAPDGEPPVDAATAGFVRRTGEGAGLLIASGDQIWFSHQLIQEFFAASYLKAEPLTAAMVETVAQPQFNEVWSGWAGLDPGWPSG